MGLTLDGSIKLHAITIGIITLFNNITRIIIETLPNYICNSKLDFNNEIITGTTTKLQLRRVELLVVDRILVQCHENIERIILKYKL
ncbi:Translation initiation factor IF-1 [Candidatus Hodgkinia cicadicola]|nr:Translation initiation factor IF-1 [Candidatus Hodgkinia cicadicola]